MDPLYAVNVALHEDRGGIPGPDHGRGFRGVRRCLLREFGGSSDRALTAVRAVSAEAADKVGYPMLWRQAALAVEMCQRAAEIARPVLPGILPAGQPAGSVRR